jgi:hypothetical protein
VREKLIGDEFPCKSCGEPIHLDDEVLSESGKRIPLEGDGRPHNCPNSEYNIKHRNDVNSSITTETPKKGTALAYIADMITEVLGNQELIKRKLKDISSDIESIKLSVKGQTTLS